MKLVKIEELNGTEILAKSVLTQDYNELISEGSILKLSYIPKLKNNGIKEVFIKDNELDAQTRLILKEDINKKCKEKVQEILSRHMYNAGQDMTEIADAAENIIANISNDNNVVQQIYDIKERSADLYEHCISTCTIATLVGLKLELRNDQIRELGIGCLLHDLGLRYVTVDFVNRNVDDMNPVEKDEYHKHPIFGYTAIRNEEWIPKISKEIILMHHETIDGEGFPLRTKDLLITTKIASACDFFDESICGIGRERKKVYEAVEYLKAYRGNKFDAAVVDELLDFIAVYPSGSVVTTNFGELAVVIRQNKGFPERPVLQLIADKQGRKIDGILVRDLLEYTNIFIEKVIN